MDLRYCEICGVAIAPSADGTADEGAICDRCFQSRKVIIPPDDASGGASAPIEVPVSRPSAPVEVPVSRPSAPAPTGGAVEVPVSRPVDENVRFICCYCQSELQIKAVRKRTKIKCPKCGELFYLTPEGLAEPAGAPPVAVAPAPAPEPPTPTPPVAPIVPPVVSDSDPTPTPIGVKAISPAELGVAPAPAGQPEDSVAVVASELDGGEGGESGADPLAEFNPRHDFFSEVPERSDRGSIASEVLEAADDGSAVDGYDPSEVDGEGLTAAALGIGSVRPDIGLSPEDEPPPDLEDSGEYELAPLEEMDEISRAEKARRWKRAKGKGAKFRKAAKGAKPLRMKKGITAKRVPAVKRSGPVVARKVVRRAPEPPPPPRELPPSLEPVAPADPEAVVPPENADGVTPVDRDDEARRALWTGAILIGVPLLISLPLFVSTVRGKGFAVRGAIGNALQGVGSKVGAGVQKVGDQSLGAGAFGTGPLPIAGGAADGGGGGTPDGGSSGSGGSDDDAGSGGSGEGAGSEGAGPGDAGSGGSEGAGAGDGRTGPGDAGAGDADAGDTGDAGGTDEPSGTGGTDDAGAGDGSGAGDGAGDPPPAGGDDDLPPGFGEPPPDNPPGEDGG